jgi:Na+/H+ antiporter NhaD/arsenite permease-like protein
MMMMDIKEYIALAVFVVVYLLIIKRSYFNNIPIWLSMLIGAALMVGLQIISPQSALKSINLDVIAFLFGMFSIVCALDKSGVLKLVAIKMLSKAKNNPNSILLVFVVGLGLLSAFLVNDTIALIGVPLVIHISRQLEIKPLVLFIALAFGISVGSVMTPIGNPQNLLIAIQSGIQLPFITFLKVLGVPTLINLFLDYFILRVYFKKELLLPLQMQKNNNNNNKSKKKKDNNNTVLTVIGNDKSSAPIITNLHLAKISIIIILAIIAGFIISEILHFLHIIDLSISIVAMLGAAALYFLSSRERKEILQSVNYSVLVFFAAMFVFTSALWSSGLISSTIMSYIPTTINHHNSNIFQSNAVISATSIILSQILSNVPFVAIYNLVMISNGGGGFNSNDVAQWMMLAAASTIAGNLTIFGAASNIIIMEAAESNGVKAFTFFEFLKIGIIETAINITVYYLYIVFLF